MLDDLKIKNDEPKLGIMFFEYRQMFTGKSLLFQLGWLGVLFVLATIYQLGPSTVNESVWIGFRVLMFLNNYFLIGWTALFLFSLLSPFLVRFALPLVSLILGIVEGLIRVLRYFLDQVIVEPLRKSFIYPDQIEEIKEKD